MLLAVHFAWAGDEILRTQVTRDPVGRDGNLRKQAFKEQARTVTPPVLHFEDERDKLFLGSLKGEAVFIPFLPRCNGRCCTKEVGRGQARPAEEPVGGVVGIYGSAANSEY